MQLGKAPSRWKSVWVIPIAYTVVAGVEALFAGSVVGLMSVFPPSLWAISCGF